MATETYKYAGTKDGGSGPLILKGSILNPVEQVVVGETIDLTEEQVKDLRASGVKLTKSGEEPDNAQAGDSGEPETRKEQQEAQRPAAASPTPASGSAGSQGKK